MVHSCSFTITRQNTTSHGFILYTQPYSYHSDWLSSELSGALCSELLWSRPSILLSFGSFWLDLSFGGGPLMLLTSDVFSDKKAWFLEPPVNVGSLKMESRKTESTVNEGPKNSSKVDNSGSSGFGMRPAHGALADLGRAAMPGDFMYSLDAELLWSAWCFEGEGSTETGWRPSLASMSWTLVRRVLPSAVEITLLARGRPEEEEEVSRRSHTDVAFPWALRPSRGWVEPLTRVLSALRRLGRFGRFSEGAAFPLADRRMPRPFGRSFWVELHALDKSEDSVLTLSWLPD